MTLSKHMEFIKDRYLITSNPAEQQALTYFIQLAEKLEEEGIAQVIKNKTGYEYAYNTIAYKQAIELSQAILSFLLDNEN